MWPSWAKSLDYDLIRRIAVSHQLEPRLVAAVVQTESAGNQYSCRYEPHFKYTQRIKELAKMCHCTEDTMRIMQMCSWGLCQVMGSVAYEHGLDKEFSVARKWPTSLLNPAIGLKYGCLHLKLNYDKWGPNPEHVYAAYNAGSVRFRGDGKLVNQENVDRFFRFYKALEI